MKNNEFKEWYESIDDKTRTQLLSRSVAVIRFADGTEMWLEPGRDPSVVADEGESKRVAEELDDFQLGIDLGNGEVEVVRIKPKLDQAAQS